MRPTRGRGPSFESEIEPLAESVLRDLPGVGVLVFDSGLRLVRVGGDGRVCDDLAPEASVGRNVLDVLPKAASGAAHQLQAAFAGRSGSFEMPSVDGTHMLTVTVAPVRSTAGEVIAGAAIAQVGRVSRATLDDVQDARTSAPRLRPGIVSRRALMLRLAETATARVVLLTAPAGYGKTTVIAQWAQADGRPFIWLRIDARHNDPEALATEISSSLVAAHGRPFVLVLDDAHNLHADAALDVISTAIGSLGDGSQIVISSRRELPLALGRLVADHDLVRLTSRNLALSAAEGASLLSAAGLEIDSADAEALVRRTEGWPAGLALAAVALGERGFPAADVDEVGGRNRVVAEYLWDEVISPLPAETAQFLLATAPLERVSGPLCDAALGVSGSGKTLQRLEREGMLVIPLDAQGEWYRQNALLRDALAAELARRDPEAEAGIHRRASEWWEAHGDVEAAVHHARLAGDVQRVGELVERLLPGCVMSGDTGSVERLLTELGRDDIGRTPMLAVAMAWSCLATGPVEACHHWIGIAEAAVQSERSGRGDAEQAALALLRAALAGGGVAAMAADAATACGLESAGSPWIPLGRFLEGVAAELAGDRDRARDCLESAERLASIGAPALRVRILAQLGLLATGESDHERARAVAEDADAVAKEHGLEDHPDTAVVDAIWACILAKDGSEARARDRAVRASEKLDGAGIVAPWSEAQTRILLAQARLRLGDGPAARALEAQARRAVRTGAPDAAILVEQLEALRSTLDAFPATSIPGAGHLTAAELRVLRHLPTHLSFREIGERLYLSRHTVKTEAISTYRKLGVNSRAGAVEHARELGIL